MKKNYFGLLATAAFCVVALFTACSSDSEDDVPEQDLNAGEFKIINITRGVELEDGSEELYKGDVLQIQFSPKWRKNFKTDYSVTVDGRKTQITDKDGKYMISYGDTEYTFTLTANYEEEGKHLSANKTIKVTQKYNVTVPYLLYITEDLKDLVKVNVKSRDEAGNFFPMETLPQYSTEKYDKVFTYEDGGVVYYTLDENKANWYNEYNNSMTGPFPAETVPMLVLNIPYYRFDIETEVELTYEQKAQIEDRDYNIGRSFVRKKAQSVTPNGLGSDVAVPYLEPMFTGEKMTSKQTKDYISKIVKERDVIKLRIDVDGNVTERK